jgi:hypothetical protein
MTPKTRASLELMVGHLMMGGGPAQPAVKAGQLQVQPLAESQMQGIASPQQRRLGQSEPGRDLEILGPRRTSGFPMDFSA